MADGPERDSKEYALPWGARAGRWWRGKREAIDLILLISSTTIAFVLGNNALGLGLVIVTLLYLVYAYTNWFNDLS